MLMILVPNEAAEFVKTLQCYDYQVVVIPIYYA